MVQTVLQTDDQCHHLELEGLTLLEHARLDELASLPHGAFQIHYPSNELSRLKVDRQVPMSLLIQHAHAVSCGVIAVFEARAALAWLEARHPEYVPEGLKGAGVVRPAHNGRKAQR
ncbi:hypothetical protein [Deinococcus ruber]|uniref:Uncharacterized protein n=1 Tax=Deinococcus ruber TaxID=1848197 RepID=A0A918FAV2_9DEIO|nr:hypothetical protein [Deinococcus ruber]GGR17433.1 hypothetical protein GCM10008957_32660 [Deinococcus ruber]